jgi:hypothetical protein
LLLLLLGQLEEMEKSDNRSYGKCPEQRRPGTNFGEQTVAWVEQKAEWVQSIE